MKRKIGIMPEALVRERLLAIAKGEYKPEPNGPKIWYTSTNAAEIDRFNHSNSVDFHGFKNHPVYKRIGFEAVKVKPGDESE